MQESCGEASRQELAPLEILASGREGLVYLQVCLVKRPERSCVKHSKASLPSPTTEKQKEKHLEIILKPKLELCSEKESLFQAQDFKITHRQLNFISKSHK